MLIGSPFTDLARFTDFAIDDRMKIFFAFFSLRITSQDDRLWKLQNTDGFAMKYV